MKRLYFKFYRFVNNEKNFPFNFWALVLFNALKVFLFFLLYNTFFLNFITNSSFIYGIKYSFVYMVLSIPISLIIYLNPLEFLTIIYNTIEKITDWLLLKCILFFIRK